jgi:hypothetical protein
VSKTKTPKTENQAELELLQLIKELELASFDTF